MNNFLNFLGQMPQLGGQQTPGGNFDYNGLASRLIGMFPNGAGLMGGTLGGGQMRPQMAPPRTMRNAQNWVQLSPQYAQFKKFGAY